MSLNPFDWMGYLLFCLTGGHDYFNGGEICANCGKANPAPVTGESAAGEGRL